MGVRMMAKLWHVAGSAGNSNSATIWKNRTTSKWNHCFVRHALPLPFGSISSRKRTSIERRITTAAQEAWLERRCSRIRGQGGAAKFIEYVVAAKASFCDNGKKPYLDVARLYWDDFQISPVVLGSSRGSEKNWNLEKSLTRQKNLPCVKKEKE
jgi:hypothetical protein